MIDSSFWKDKRVMVTGHTGFKGSWLCLWLEKLGAKVSGYALKPPTTPSLFQELKLEERIQSYIGDICDLEKLKTVVATEKPEIVFHLAAQPLVRDSYLDPVNTYKTNVLGTVHVLESIRLCTSVRVGINVTTDKVYENQEWCWPYREFDPLGGYDPYSNSKACSELVTASYRQSFFPLSTLQSHGVGIATARAGNVIGGGDWAKDRLVPDILRSFQENKSLQIRYPQSVRPWQHVLEPLSGYMLLAQRLFIDPRNFSGAWNFGPDSSNEQPVQYIVKYLMDRLGGKFEITSDPQFHEAHFLKLDCSKAKSLLKWYGCWDLSEALTQVLHWHKEWEKQPSSARMVSLAQINAYESAVAKMQNEMKR